MPPRYITKTSLAGLHLVTLDGAPILSLHARLTEVLHRRGAGAAAALFAEPVSTPPSASTPGSIAWYADLQGAAEPLFTLSTDRRAGPEAALRGALQALSPLLDDPEAGPLLRRALAIPSADSVLTVGGMVLLTDWGLVVEGAGSEEEQAARGAAWASPYLARPVVSLAAASPATPGPMPAVVPAPAAVLAPAAASAAVPRYVPPSASRSAWDWALIPAAIVTAGLFLGTGLWIGARLVAARVAERPSTVALLDERATRDATERQREQNAALLREIEARRRLLAADVCTPDPAQVPRLGPDRSAAVPPTSITPTPGIGPFQGSLAELLTQAVVLIVAPAAAGDGMATGTGFFITPELIVTNRHVIEGADAASLVVTSKKLGRTTRATVVAQTPDSEIGNPDVAVLRVETVTGLQPLSFSTTAAPLDQVIAAGFPGLLMQSDEAFARLRRGDSSAMPEVILTDGRINAVQSAPGGLRIMPHSAAVSSGNSGGPLVDACGRVLGINTFITANREQVVHANYAQKSDGVIAFLRQNGTDVADLSGPCAPNTAPAPTPTAVPGPASPATSPAGAPSPAPPAPPPAAPPAAR